MAKKSPARPRATVTSLAAYRAAKAEYHAPPPETGTEERDALADMENMLRHCFKILQLEFQYVTAERERLLGILAKTEIGKRFRSWVLDLIEHRHEEHSWYAAYRDVVQALCAEYSSWERIHFLFTIGTPIKDIARRQDLHPSTVSRAIKKMRRYKLLTDAQYKQARADGRLFVAARRTIRREKLR